MRTPTTDLALASNIGRGLSRVYGNPPPVAGCWIIGREVSRSLIAGFPAMQQPSVYCVPIIGVSGQRFCAGFRPVAADRYSA